MYELVCLIRTDSCSPIRLLIQLSAYFIFTVCKGWRPSMIGATQWGDIIKLVPETDRSPVINIIRKVETAILHISISWIFLVKQTAVGCFRVLENIVCFFSFWKFLYYRPTCAVHVSLIGSSVPVHHIPDPLGEDNPPTFGVWWLRWSTVRITIVFKEKQHPKQLW